MKRALVFLLVAGCIEGMDARYEDPQGGFTVRHPSDWTSKLERGSVVFSGEDKQVTVLVNSAPRKESWRVQDRSLESTTKAAKKMLLGFTGAKVVREQKVTVNGLPGVVFEVGFTHEGRAYKRRQWVIEGEKRIGYVGYTAPIAKWDTADDVAEAMLHTLELGGNES